MKPDTSPTPGICSRCGECCRWLPIVLVRQCKPHQLHYLRERGLKEADGFFLADAPCRHLKLEESNDSGTVKWTCSIYDKRPATCRDFSGKSLSTGKRFYVPEGCTMAGGKQGSGSDPKDPFGTITTGKKPEITDNDTLFRA